jgi:type II secretory pathway pseudopilin PulG
MVIHSDSNLGAVLSFLAVIGIAATLLISVAQAVSGKFRRALKSLLVAVAMAAAWMLAVISVSLLSPRTIVSVGDSYCDDIWCISVEGVHTQASALETTWRVGVRIFSDANRVQISARGASIWLTDDRGRRFPLLEDRSAPPFDMTLNPGQSVRTSLTFVAPSDVQHLYLTGSGTPSLLARLYPGSDDSLLHKPTLLRVF